VCVCVCACVCVCVCLVTNVPPNLIVCIDILDIIDLMECSDYTSSRRRNR
jgi:hypothetical protein